MNIPLFKIYQDESDIINISNEIESGKNWAVGPNVKEFEKEIADYIGTKYAVTFNSGTSALHANLLAYGIGSGDEVIVPSFTFIATANSPLFVGAKPVFADIEKETFGLDPEKVEEKITKDTKAIMPVHYGGCPCKINELRDIAEDNDLILMEDAAEAFGANVNNKNVGTFGDSNVLSFCQNKVITTGEGGAVVTDNEEIFDKLNLIRSHGRLEGENYFDSIYAFEYVDLGFNWRMSNLTATLGLSQIQKADKIIELRRKQSNYLNTLLSGHEDNIELITPPKGYNHVYQLYSLCVKNRDELAEHLSKNGISSKIYFDPIHLSPFYKDKLGYNDNLPVTEEISKNILTLPMFPSISNEEIEYIAKIIGEFYE